MASAKALLGAVAGRFLFRHGTATKVTTLGPHFRRVEVEGDELRGAPFVPGDKVQVFLPGEGMRTYTPLEWREHRTTLLGFVHGGGPGSRWLEALTEGAPVAFFGPRRSVDVSAVRDALLVVGDETSLALTCALTRAESPRRVSAVLEATEPAEVRAVARALELSAVTVVPRGALEPAVRAQLEGAVPVFTGRAASIQALKRALPTRPGSITRAYWAENKRGLD